MKKLLFTMWAMVMASVAMAANPAYVRVVPKSGSPVLFAFASQPEISMLADGVKISSIGASPVSFKFEEVQNIDFPENSGIELPGETSILVSTYPDSVVFSDIPEGNGLKLFSISGQLVKSVDNMSEITLYKADYPGGIYIAVIGNTSFKIIL